MSKLTRDGTAEPVSRDQILRHERGQGNIHFSCSADHVQDWQPYPVDPYSCYMCDHTYIHGPPLKGPIQQAPCIASEDVASNPITGAWCKSPNDRILSCKDALQRTEYGRLLLWSGALLRMGDHRLPRRVVSGELENAGKRVPGRKEKGCREGLANDLRVFGITGGTGRPPY